MHTLIDLSWRAWPSAALMLAGGWLAWRAWPRGGGRRSLLSRVLGYWRASIWLTLVAFGAGWWLGLPWLMALALGLFIAEGWESCMVIGGLRGPRRPARD